MGRVRIGVGLAAAALVGAAGASLFGGTPARALLQTSALDLVCGTELPNRAAIPAAGAFTVHATAPDGTTRTYPTQGVHPFGSVDPETGGGAVDGIPPVPRRTYTVQPPSGSSLRTTSIDNTSNGDSTDDDATFGWATRTSTGTARNTPIDLGVNPLRRLYIENFQQPAEVNSVGDLPAEDVRAFGVDFHVVRDKGTRLLNHKLSYTGFVDLVSPSGAITHLRLRYELDGRGQGAQLPDQANLAFVVRGGTGAAAGQLLMGLSLETRYLNRASGATGDLAPSAFPALTVNAKVDTVDSSGNVQPGDALLDTSLTFAKAPADIAFGFRHTCNSSGSVTTAHVGTVNGCGATSTAPPVCAASVMTGAIIDAVVRVLPGSGQQLPPSGNRGDIVTVVGRLENLPARVDVLTRPERTTITRSSGTSPILTLQQFVFAPDDHARENEAPLFVSGRISSLPQHLRVDSRLGGARSATEMDAKAYTLSCTGTEQLSDLPLGTSCTKGNPTAIAQVQVQAQNFVPGDTAASSAMGSFNLGIPATGACPTTGDTELVRLGIRQDISSRPDGLFQFGTCMNGVRSAAFRLPPDDDPNDTLVTTAVNRTAAATIDTRVGAVLVDDGRALRIDAAGDLVDAPALITMRFQPRTMTESVATGGIRRTRYVDVATQTSSTLSLRLDSFTLSSGPAAGPLVTDLVASGAVTDLPAHVRIRTATESPKSGATPELVNADVQACPSTAPDDPFVAGGGMAPECASGRTVAGRVAFTVRNFTDSTTGAAVCDVLGSPSVSTCPLSAGGDAVQFGFRDDRATTETAYQVGWPLTASGRPPSTFRRRATRRVLSAHR